MVIGLRQRVAALKGKVTPQLNNAEFQQVHSVTCLGVNIDQHLTWDSHIVSIRQKVTRNIGILNKFRPILNRENEGDFFLHSPHRPPFVTRRTRRSARGLSIHAENILVM